MINYEDEILEIIEFVKKNSKADDYDLNISVYDSTFFRFGGNRITQNGTGVRYSVNIESSFDQKTGSASVNSFSKDQLLQIIKKSEEIAILNQKDPEYVERARSIELPSVDNYSENTNNLTKREMIENVDKTIKRAQSENVQSAGITDKSFYHRALSTKNGFYGYDKQSFFSHSMTFFDKNRESKNVVDLKDYSIFNLDNELDKISNKLNALNNPMQSEKGKIPVILTPQAVTNFFMYLIYSFDRRNADLGMNCFTDKLGTQFFGKDFNFRSVLEDKDLITQKFSGNGLVGKSVDWIKDGVLKELRVGKDWAKLKNLEPNFMCNFVIDGGDSDLKSMMKMVKRGLIINNFWYIRSVDMRNGIWTGLTRDGVNYFEDGEIKHSVTNLRFNESHAEISKRILALGAQEQTGYSTKVPWMLIDDFNFVDVTSF